MDGIGRRVAFKIQRRLRFQNIPRATVDFDFAQPFKGIGKSKIRRFNGTRYFQGNVIQVFAALE
jgi:hypothetical protein